MLFLVVFLDMIGVGIVIPILAPLMLDMSSEIVPAAWNLNVRNIALGLLIATYPALQFFGAPVLGALSDRFGRKPVLGFSLFGTMVGYLLFAYGLFTNQLWLLFASRALDGFTGGNISVAQSSIADMSKEKDKAKNFGMIGAAFGIGFILGPFLGGILSDPNIVSWFNRSVPFLFAAGLTALNLIILLTVYRETIKNRVMRKISIFMGFNNIGKAFRIRSLAKLFVVVGLFNLGFSFFTQFYPALLVTRFEFTESDIGALFGVIGLFLAINQGITTRFVARYLKPEQVLRFSLLGVSLMLFISAFPQNILMLYITQILITLPAALTFPNSTAMVSQICPKEKQGEILGINQSVSSAGHAIPPIIAGFIVAFGEMVPTLTASGIVFVAWALYMVFFRKK